ncbi:MAG: hypothetical protein H7A23_13580 [Leptospiraceae bacterium]|nr:hypothetical protein [Leptospiraceae bacterium]MCP5495582.1 hypothetical protein [Leptospiraceae bacterium]
MTSHKAVSSCILCDNNCGIEIHVENREFKSFKGYKAHPASEGYVCQKPGRLNYYQNHSQRLTSPLKRQSDGSFKEISWDQRRSYNANHIIRNPEWRKSDKNGALQIHPKDGEKYGLTDGAKAVCETPFGKADVTIEYVDSAFVGFVSLPHGYGMTYSEGGIGLEESGRNK